MLYLEHHGITDHTLVIQIDAKTHLKFDGRTTVKFIMPVTYFHRYRMQYDLREGLFAVQDIPVGYSFIPWDERLLNDHAEVKFESFRNELDASVFPCLGEEDGCRRLMREISCRQGFIPEATWLIRHSANENTADPDHPTIQKPKRYENCGTVQGIRSQTDVGTIQNIGISQTHRGKGLGTLLVYHCLKGFQEAGVRFVTLEVTSHNTGAFRLYKRLGFRVLKTVFKSVEISY